MRIEKIVKEIRETETPVLYAAIEPPHGWTYELYDRLMYEDDILPVAISDWDDFDKALATSLREWARRHRRTHRHLDLSPRQISYILEVAGLRLFVIVRHADDVDVGKLLKDLKAMEDLFNYAGVMLVFYSRDVFKKTLNEIDENWLKRGDVIFF